MAKVLYINAHPGAAEYSKSQTIANEFVKTYLEKNPQDEVTYLNLWTLDAPDVDSIVYAAFGILMGGAKFEDLSSEQQIALSKRQRVIDQFIAHDKYIFVTPMWEFSFPAVLKKYLDIICAARQTFRYNEIGMAVGLLKHKQAVLIQASGGNYTTDARNKLRQLIEQHQDAEELLAIFNHMGNLGEPVIRATLAIMGVHNFHNLAIHSQALPSLSSEAFAQAQAEARELALRW